MAKDSNYVMRMMRARCSCGTIDNYLNVGRDHGVLAGAEQQPVLNANDHTEKNLIHFGNCESGENPERSFRKGLVSGLMGPAGWLVGDKVTDFLEDVGIMTCKCKPNTPVPWINVNENNLLEGAPALLMESKVPCRYGGTISLVPLDEYPPEEPAPQDQEVKEEAPMEDVVRDAVEAAINSAMEKVAQTGEAGAETVSQVQAALAAAAAMKAQSESGAAHSCVGETPAIHDFSDVTYNSLFKMTDQVRAQNYAHNMAQKPDPGAEDNNGMIINQNLLKNYRINNYGVDYAGCGAISLYNTIKTLDPNTNITFPQVIYWMEPYGIFNNTFGATPFGVADCLNQMGYDTKFVPAKLIGKEAANADAAIVLYATTANVHYVAFNPSGKDKDGNTVFTFYNENSGGNDNRTYEEFRDGLNDNRTRIGEIGIVVYKKE